MKPAVTPIRTAIESYQDFILTITWPEALNSMRNRNWIAPEHIAEILSIHPDHNADDVAVMVMTRRLLGPFSKP